MQGDDVGGEGGGREGDAAQHDAQNGGEDDRTNGAEQEADERHSRGLDLEGE
ncbi:hypothetical protein D3C83_328750 [compost metagenome]